MDVFDPVVWKQFLATIDWSLQMIAQYNFPFLWWAQRVNEGRGSAVFGECATFTGINGDPGSSSRRQTINVLVL